MERLKFFLFRLWHKAYKRLQDKYYIDVTNRGGKRMKRLWLLILMLLVCSIGWAEGEPLLDITMKQGIITSWDEFKIENLSTVEIVKTKPIEGAGNWNALIDGWSLDLGMAYDAGDNISTVVLMLGRNFGTLGEYLPFIEYPLLDQIKVTLYPVGFYASDLNDEPKFSGASGLGVISFNVVF